MAVIESMISKKVTKPYAEKAAEKVREKIDGQASQEESKDSERTKRLKESKITDDFLGIKKGVRYGATKLSEGLDRLGFTGEKKKETEPAKKAKGGMVKSSASKRADGCAIRGKTRA